MLDGAGSWEGPVVQKFKLSLAQPATLKVELNFVILVQSMKFFALTSQHSVIGGQCCTAISYSLGSISAFKTEPEATAASASFAWLSV